MCELTLYRDCDPGSITVSNFFIDEYLADANDCQIKVYLYLIRMLSAKKLTNISDIADMFNHTEKDVCRALRYWEKKGIMSLDYDSNGGIVGIRMHEPTRMAVAPVATPMPVISPVVSPVPAAVSAPASITSMVDFPGNRASAMVDTSVSDETLTYHKPSYSAAALKEFKQREETSQLIFVAEQYLKKPLSASDIRSIMFYCDELGFSSELIDHLLQFCVSRGKYSFAYMDKVAIDWAEHDIDSVKKARAYTSDFEGDPSSSGKARAKSSSATKKKTPATMFHQFEQNDYDFGKLEKQLLRK